MKNNLPNKKDLDITLKELRIATAKTQVEMAETLKVRQSEVSRIESRTNHRVSTLRDYVKVLGGELQLFVRMNDKLYRIG
jgi:transcriptional regulator with XRE-family HTH domain